MARIVPTPGQLAAAFGACRLPGWPEDLEAAMAHPVLSRLVNLHAVRLAQGHDDFAERRTVQRPVVEAPEPPHPADPPMPCTPRPRRQAKPRRAAPSVPTHPLPLVDRKRAAGGDDD